MGADALSSLFKGVPPRDGQQTTTHPFDTNYHPHQQPYGLKPHHTTEDVDVLKMRRQEMGMAQLHQEAEVTRKLIAEARRDAKGVVAARDVAKAQQDVEIARQEDTRQARMREEADQATTLAAEAAKHAHAQALADAREQEHRMAVQVAIARKAKQDKELANLHDAKAAAAELDHGERVLAATREENDRLLAELVHARQVAQQTADLEARRIVAQAKAPEMAVRKVMDAKAKDAMLEHQRQMQAEAAVDLSVKPSGTTEHPRPNLTAP